MRQKYHKKKKKPGKYLTLILRNQFWFINLLLFFRVEREKPSKNSVRRSKGTIKNTTVRVVLTGEISEPLPRLCIKLNETIL